MTITQYEFDRMNIFAAGVVCDAYNGHTRTVEFALSNNAIRCVTNIGSFDTGLTAESLDEAVSKLEAWPPLIEMEA